MPETIFMIHGMWGGPWYWENYRRMFEVEGYRCVVPTLPFHDMDPQGVPDPRLGTTGLLDYADFLEREILKLGEMPIVMGHSMGSLLAQILGARGLASSLVLLTPASPAGILALKPSAIRSFGSILASWGFWRKPVRQTRAEAVYAVLHLVPEGERQRILDKFVYESGKAAFEIGYWFLDSGRASRIDESKVRCPVLVIGASQDHITPASVARKVAKKYGATYKEFENHAHWVVAEPDWQEVAAYASEWLRSMRAAASGL
jgi:pimeloyl-ACP methyl ester carboxylesterase